MAARRRREMPHVVAALVLFGLLAACHRADAAVFEGKVEGKSGLVFLGKFAFGYTPSGGGPAGEWAATLTTDSTGVTFALFDDQSISWPAVYDNADCDCTCASAAARYTGVVTPGQTTQLPDSSNDIFEHERPRFWYAALISCSSMSVDYKVTFLQADGSQFSYNDEGLYALYLVCFFLWGFALGAQLWASRWLWRTRTFHPIVKLFTISVVLWWLMICCLMIHWSVYRGNGEGVPFLQGLGHVFEVFARVSFMLLVMLIASGWTISSTVLQGRVQILVSIGVVLVVYLILAIWDLAGRNPATTTFLYDSAPGVIIAVLHLVLCVWFLWRIRKTYYNEVHSEKTRFYRFFGVVYGLWFLLLPVVVLVGSLVAPTYRTKVVMILLMILNSIAAGVLGFMLWPSRATHYFEIQTDHFVASTQQYEDL